MNNEFEYYKVHRKSDNNIPLLNPDTGCPRYLYTKIPIENPEILKFKFGQPIPKKPQMADFHSSPYSVISKKIYDVLAPLNLDEIQFLPAVIHADNDDIFTNYWAIHTYKRIRCIDPKESDCEIGAIRIANVKKLVLDKKKLKTIPLQKRFIFRLEEDSSYELYHVSMVEKIMNVNPGGIRFTNIEEWNSSSPFKK